MRLEDFDYDLPDALIAQEALADRSASRLLVVDRAGDAAPGDAHFRDLPALLDPDDVVVVNRSRVVPARLFVRRHSGARIEVLYIRRLDERRFVAWVRGLAKLDRGEALLDDAGRATLRFVEPLGNREAVMALLDAPGLDTVDHLLEAYGHVPLPPYIRRDDTPGDRARYQTVYADERGSVAAPTAGLHFDDNVMAGLRARGIDILSIVLHVGPGTFSPLELDTVEDNVLHAEEYAVDADTLSRLASARAAGRRIVAVGTTVARALESAHAAGWLDAAPVDRKGETDLFIRPGYTFSVVDRLVTNFHLPRSSLLIRVCAFLGRERALGCYRLAVERRYRFYSYGDAMVIR
jgi:S-adenosylmethionine:tRNA ribosyltransferase-isomerase